MTNFLDKHIIIEPPETMECVYEINDILGEEKCCRDTYFDNKKAIHGDKLEKIESIRNAQPKNKSVDMIVHLRDKNNKNVWLLVECKCRMTSKKARSMTSGLSKKASDSKKLLKHHLSDIAFLDPIVLLLDENFIKKHKGKIKDRLKNSCRQWNLIAEFMSPYQLAKNLIQTTGVHL